MYGTAFSLRTILQHQCHDLQNLTTSELQECKWLTKKKVFSAQFNASVVLQEQSEELAVLNDDRNAESALQKKNNVEREVRVESEKNYRTSFMRVVLSGLTKLRWPPSQEAFSDPIDLLFNDDASFLDAVRFLSQVALPATHQHHYRKDFLESPPKTTGINRPTSPGKLASKNEYAFNSSISIIENESNNLPDISELGLSLQNEVANADLGIACEDVSAGELLGLQNHLPREKRMELNWKAFEVLQRQNELLSARLRELQLRVIRRDETETKIAGILSELRSTIAEIAGAGNLSSERKGGGGSKKGQQDSSFASILRPSETSSVHTATQAIANTSMSKEQEMDAFRLEAEREAHEIVAKKDKVLLPTSAVPTSAVAPSDVANGKAGTKRKTAVPVTRTSEATGPPTEATKESPGASSYAQSPSVAAATPNVLWSKLLGRVTALEAQWSAAQRSARQLVDSADLREQKAFAYVPTLKGSPPLQRTSNNSSRDGSSGESRVQYSARLTPSRSVVNHTFGVQPALVSSADASFSGNHPFGTSNHISAYSSTSSPPHPPPFSARSSVHSVAAAGAELQDSSRLALDLSRVHLLQRDLVAFAESAFAWTSDTVFPAPDISTHTTDVHSRVGSRSNGSRMGGVRDGSAQMPLVLSADQRALGRQQSALALQAASWDLLLHLSCVAPIVPLALDSPLRSSMTGLDALVHEITESAFPKVSKQTQARLQAAADRALSEQVAVIRSWRQARSCLSQWTEHASAAAPTLQNVSKRYKILVEQAVRDLQQKSSSLSLITQALGEAESARIRAGAAPANDDTVHLGTSSRNSSFRRGGGATGAGAGAAISPLDSLARGSAGREVAALVIALRANQDELVGTAQTVSALGCTLVSELRRELDFFGHTEASLTAAANATHGVLQQSSRLGDILPQGCAAAMAVSAQEQEEALLSTGPASAGLRKGTRRRAAEATSSPTSTKGTTSGKQQATPLSNRPAFDLSMN